MIDNGNDVEARARRAVARLSLFLCAVIFLCTRAAEASSGRPTFADVEKAFLQERYDIAVSSASKLINSGGSKRDELYYIKGLSEMKSNKFSDARTSFAALIERYPHSKRAADAMVGKGDSYLMEGNLNAALSTYEDILKRNPGDKNEALILYRIGTAQEGLGHRGIAQSYFDRVKKLSPMSFEARMTGSAAAMAYNAQAPVTAKTALSNKIASQTVANSFNVQIGSFRNRDNAEKMARKIGREGYSAAVESGGNLYRVKIGNYRTRDEARRIAKELKKRGYDTKICAGNVCEI